MSASAISLKGANACITNHSVGGALAVIEAAEALRNGEADRAIAIGHDTPIEPQNVLYYHECGLLSRDALRPFDAARDGSVFGEGAGALALETEAAARARNAPVVGEVLGGGFVSEASGLLAIRDDGDGVVRAIEAALADAQLRADDVGMIVAHGNGTRAVRCIGGVPRSGASSAMRCPPVTAFKWALGHLIAAAGIVETTIALAALHARTVPGIAALSKPDPALARLAAVARGADAPQRCRARDLSRIRRHQCGAAGARSKRLTAAPLPSGATSDSPVRCGIDTVEIARIERLLDETPAAELTKLFSAQELADSGSGPGRAASLAARYAAKEACVKLFPRELAAGRLEPADFSIARDGYGAPQVVCSPHARRILDQARIAGIAASLTHDRTSASAVALALPMSTPVPFAGRVLFNLLPFRRRVIVENLRRVFGAAVPPAEIDRLAQAHYAHLWKLIAEFVRFRWLSPERKRALVRVDNLDAFVDAFRRGAGVLILTGHFGNWEVATVAGIQNYPEVRGRFHFVRRPIKPRWLDALFTRRFNRSGIGVVAKRGSLDRIVSLLERGDVVVFPFDQYAGGTDGIDVEFFGQPAGTFRSLAVIALATGAPVVPAACWREPDGTHVLRFEPPVPPADLEDVNESIRRTTRAYNAALERLVLRHPEQWWWVHRRWKSARRKRRSSAAGATGRSERLK